ncbi:unnamed protein product [Rotaria sordida]|uniref:F-box domain-containing protein n=1 Tax=Rotaria sordida TaxID=392033 RepID=A0A814X062_9BILA|nr:unnamed protein product [Rotaria sordida]CAF1208963.1 unnamed protein product [Rotaria sordida]
MSIETLPVELFHCILDNLDTETIVFSVRHVCRLFRSFVNTYDRYILNLISISKRNFHLLCRLIHPHHVISLKLSNEERIADQIDLFISLIRLRQFTRLYSITLLDIKECQLNFILKRINLNLLTSFSFNIKRYDDRRIQTTNKYLRSIVSQLNFRKMEFNLKNERISKFSWPCNCSIQYLIINENISMNNLSNILQCSPHLHKIILKQELEDIITNVSLKSTRPIYFPQLTSLTMEKYSMTIGELESFISLTPSLVYLKLIGEQCIFDGKRWEQFIEINLPNLDKFEFYFDYWSLEKKTSEDLELIIASFRTSFWIEHKKCQLYTREISVFEYFQKSTTSQIMFSNVTKVNLQFYEEWSLLPLEYLSIFIDISQLVQMTLVSSYFTEYNQNVLADIRSFIEQAYNLSALIIQTGMYRYNLNLAIEKIHDIIPYHVKYLRIPINSTDQIQIILNRCNHLTQIAFDIRYSNFSEEIIKWFDDNTMNSTYWKDYQMVSVWLGTRKIQSTEIYLDQKRMKLS